MTNPVISVVMSVFNGERFLSEAMSSILDQSFTRFEFIVINDGSTDRSDEILESYRSKDSRIQIVHQANCGLVDSLNRGCDLARGEYIARMDADDVAMRDRLMSQIRFMEMHPEVGVVGGDVEFIDANGRLLNIPKSPLIRRDYARALLDRCVLWHPTVLMRKATFISVGGYRNVVDAEDYDLWLRIAEQSRLANLEEVLLRYRLHPGQVSAARCKEQSLGALAALTSARIRRSGSPDPLVSIQKITPASLLSMGVDQRTLQTSIARGYLTWARNMCRAGEYLPALNMLHMVCSPAFERAERWTIAEAYLWTARIYCHQRRFGKSLFSIGRAVIARPIMLGRPIKPILKLFRTKE